VSFRFERFTDVDRAFDAKVTVRSNGQLGLNTGAVNLYTIREFTHVILYYDRDARVVGIELCNNAKVPGAIKIIHGFGNVFIKAKNFCDKYAIPYAKSRRFELKRDEESGFLFFNLDRPIDGGDEGGSAPSQDLLDDVPI
jgi:hypothetical protein